MTLEYKDKSEDPKTLLLYWDGELLKEVHKGLFRSELRKIPRELTKEGFLAQMKAAEERIGRRYSIYLLSRRNYLSGALEERLCSRGISPQVAKIVVQSCLEKGYLNDTQEVARMVAKEARKGRSTKAIFYKLRQKKGVDSTLLKTQVESGELSEKEILEKWLTKHAKRINREDREAMKKLIAKLCRQGFSYELVTQTLRQEEFF
jgi:SOS response regulatory protein OraA/RecX